MELLRNFKEISKNDVGLAGGKGASLGEMTQAGISVPQGFVVLSTTFDRFLEETDLDVEIDSVLHTVNHKEMHTVEDASEKIQALILSAKMPQDIAKEIELNFKKLGSQFVAVRSSATAEDSSSAAWAGQLESYLNTTDKTLLENVQRCWASLFTPRAIFYRFEQGLHKHKISVAVVVQKMVESEKSGIAFSVHPVTQDYNQLIIEAGFGLGEAIVSGQITPDSYVIEKQPRRIIDKNVEVQSRGLYRAGINGNEWQDIPQEKGEKQTLTDKEVLELSEIVLKIENHYGFPVDIEWAREKGKFYIVQSRPITTLIAKNFSSTQADLKGSLYDEKRDWVHYLTRSFTLFGASLWQEWYNSDAIRTLFKSDMRDVLFIEEHKNIARSYRVKEQLQKFQASLADLIISNEAHIITALRRAEQLNKKAEQCLKKGPRAFQDLESAVLFLIEVAIYATVFSHQLVAVVDSKKIKCSKKILKQAEKLREISYYPSLVNKIVEPLAKERLVCFGIKEASALEFVTYKELIAGNVDIIKERKEQRRTKMLHFVYQNLDGQESIEWISETSATVAKLEHISADQDYNEILGQIVFHGNIRGVARIILTPTGEWARFDTGDILVSINANPSLMPLIQKASAIVTDEGGIACHAAIIARELKIPCIIGTKIATQILKDGDLVEVSLVKNPHFEAKNIK